MWTAADIEIRLIDEISERDVITIRVVTPAGELILMAEVERFDRELVLAGLHIQSTGLGPNRLGWARLRQIARAVAEKLDVDLTVVKGAVRTTGAVRNRLPGRIRFTR